MKKLTVVFLGMFLLSISGMCLKKDTSPKPVVDGCSAKKENVTKIKRQVKSLTKRINKWTRELKATKKCKTKSCIAKAKRIQNRITAFKQQKVQTQKRLEKAVTAYKTCKEKNTTSTKPKQPPVKKNEKSRDEYLKDKKNKSKGGGGRDANKDAVPGAVRYKSGDSGKLFRVGSGSNSGQPIKGLNKGVKSGN